MDVRIISANNKELEQEVIDGNFREDSFFRLNVIPIKEPRCGIGGTMLNFFQAMLCKRIRRSLAKIFQNYLLMRLTF
nr:sigma 54-interacting transcriptional regulator [uncultured Desulfobacter sp.]